VPDVTSSEDTAWARLIVRRFAAATDLLVAGRRIAVAGTSSRASALRDVLAAFGARPVDDPEQPDYLFLTEAAVLPRASDRPLVVVDATDDGLPIPGALLRRDVYATDDPDIVQVRAAVNRARIPLDGESVAEARGRVEWARRFMPVAASLVGEFATSGRFVGLRIGMSMVLEPKTAVFALLLRETGAIVTVFAHPDELDDAVAAVLRDSGIPVFGRRDAGAAEHLDSALAFLNEQPQLLIDDGSHLIRLAHSHLPEVLDTVIGAAEETTSGLRPLRRMAQLGALRVPVIAVNDARSKTLFDNRYGTGQSCVFAIADLLERDLEGAAVVVVGYGNVGAGVAEHARALGATVVIVETDAVRALQATYVGLRVQPLLEAVTDADLVISATGVRSTIPVDALLAARTDAVFAVAGGVPQEIAIDDAVERGAVRATIGDRVERFTFPTGATVRILDDGGCINVTAGEGNPIEIMDLSFAVQAAALRHLVEHSDLAPGVYDLPRDADDAVASAARRSAGYAVDAQTDAATSGVEDWHTARFGALS
jgi:adenosylhomocysteinase